MAAAVGQLSWWTYRQPRAVYKYWARLWLVLVVGAMDADAQCTLCTGPWSSTGPVPCMVLSACCCATTGAVATLLVYAWLDSGYMFCVFTWVRYGRISHNFYVKAVGTQILKLILHPALLVKWRSMHSRCFDC